MKGKPSMSLAEMAARAAGAPAGRLECPKCGCCDFRTYGTEQPATLTFRYKSCRHCGCKVYTSQEPERLVRIVGAEDNALPDEDGFGESVI